MSTLTEADVLFEMFLPMLCKQHAAAMERFSGTVVFEQFGDEPRTWTLKGCKKPWVQRGDDAKADARVSIRSDIVQAVVRGYDVDLNIALSEGSLRLNGSMHVFEELGFTWTESQTLLDLMLKR